MADEMLRIAGRGDDGTAKAIKTDNKGNVGVQLMGSNMEYYGATVTQRPAPNSVPVGAIYMAVDTQEMWQSNGTTWKVI